jgi:purine-binding chemotaxis protein CheW
MTATVSEASQASLAGKYLTFRLGKESYGIGVLRIREIIRVIEVTPVPQMPAYVKGVVNLRGKIIPIVDLREKFALSNIQDTEQTCVVVVQVTQASGLKALMGLLVDAVEEVVNFGAADIEETPDFGGALDTEYMLGMAKVRGAVKTLLDIDKVIAAAELNRVTQAQALAA